MHKNDKEKAEDLAGGGRRAQQHRRLGGQDEWLSPIWARRFFELGAYANAREIFEELRTLLGAPPEMMMFSTRVRPGEPQEVFISLPDYEFLDRFKGFEECREPHFRRDEITGLVFEPTAFARKFTIPSLMCN